MEKPVWLTFSNPRQCKAQREVLTRKFALFCLMRRIPDMNWRESVEIFNDQEMKQTSGGCNRRYLETKVEAVLLDEKKYSAKMEQNEKNGEKPEKRKKKEERTYFNYFFIYLCIFIFADTIFIPT